MSMLYSVVSIPQKSVRMQTVRYGMQMVRKEKKPFLEMAAK
jgi:hypothetical protein